MALRVHPWLEEDYGGSYRRTNTGLQQQSIATQLLFWGHPRHLVSVKTTLVVSLACMNEMRNSLPISV